MHLTVNWERRIYDSGKYMIHCGIRLRKERSTYVTRVHSQLLHGDTEVAIIIRAAMIVNHFLQRKEDVKMK